MSERYDKGMEVRRAVLGNDHVDRAELAKTPFDAPFQEMITETAWGTLWASDTISKRDRSLITLALLAAGGHWDEVAMHIRATANTGATPAEVREAFMHVAIYAGVPAANHALKIAKATYAEMGVEI
ncbi:4-carboxymuconolactone decarboxylase [Profundibacter amoris]|uniref:4-carboxymuconolactone decarboxylase n=1 Tax=Profundibacter amoris TaxID=2171755 RepID=A0A347UDV1_9RHOB|nr:4-carboxymuconolactone decarboxylase [Profundibacter amoris]AXX97029.1 4-carboxymuconolactone decarboxylase [Profundibacter amoris]